MPLGTGPQVWLLVAILAGALGVRLLPLSADLPYFCSSFDEANYIENALRFGTGTIRMPSYFHGALYPMVLFLEYAAYFSLGRLLGLFGSASDFALAYLADPTTIVLLARTTVVLCSLGVVALTYAVASRVYNARVGAVAALFAAFSLLMFQMSFLALADIPAVLFLMLATYLAILSVERPNERKLYCVAGILIGLAAACKYHTGFGVVTLYLAAFMKCADGERCWKGFARLAGLGTAFAALGFFVGMPQALLEPVVFYEHVFRRLGGQMLGYNPEGKAWLFLFTHHLRNGLGVPLEAASLAGLGVALYHRTRWDLLLLSFPLAFYALFMHSVGWAYHLLPAVPFLLILAARMLDAVAERLAPSAAFTVSLALGAMVVAPTFLDSVKFVQVMRSPSTKTTAKAWIEEHIPVGSTVLAEGYFYTDPIFAPVLVESRSSLERDLSFIRSNNGSGRTMTLRLANYDRLYDHARVYDIVKVRSLDAEALGKERPPYVVMSSAMDGPAGKELAGMFMKGDYQERQEALRRMAEERQALKEDIRSDYEILATVAPTVPFTEFFPHLMDQDYRLIRDWPLFSDGLVRGPTITIWAQRSPSRPGL